MLRLNAEKIKVLIPLIFLLFNACSVQKITIRYASGIFDAGVKAIFSETDYEIAKSSIPANLKLLEAIYNVDPKNEKITTLLVQGYTGYAMGFVEDEDPQRAKLLYKRAFEFGINYLKAKNKKFAESLNAEFEKFEKTLKSEFTKKDVPILFWTTMAWGSYVNLSRDDPDAIGQIPKIEAMVKRTIELDENYFYGSADMFLGVLLSARPKMFGGDPEKGKEYFEKCIKISDGKYLLPYVFYARYYAVQIQDKELFEKLLNYVIDSPAELLKDAELLNIIAKKKAERFKNMTDELF
jgi:tetratricopeptide (TPR) repeat protein